MHNFDYKIIPGKLSELIELRDNSEYAELKDLWWPRYDWNCWNYMHNYRISPEFFAKLMTHVESPGIMVQAGGNCGQYVRQFSQRFKTVYTFEPDPLNFLCLTLNCGNNVIKTQACLGNDKNFVDINRKLDAGAIHVDGPGPVPTVRVDDMDLPSCDLIQLDIEGYEYFALLGAQRTIEKYHPVIMIEWYGPWAQRYGVSKDMMDSFFKKLKYKKVLGTDNDIVYKRLK
jgi:FkbM family methyltransferase